MTLYPCSYKRSREEEAPSVVAPGNLKFLRLLRCLGFVMLAVYLAGALFASRIVFAREHSQLSRELLGGNNPEDQTYSHNVSSCPGAYLDVQHWPADVRSRGLEAHS